MPPPPPPTDNVVANAAKAIKEDVPVVVKNGLGGDAQNINKKDSSSSLSTTATSSTTAAGAKMSKETMDKMFGNRSLAAAGRRQPTGRTGGGGSSSGGPSSMQVHRNRPGGISAFKTPDSGVSEVGGKFLVIGDGLMGPFLAQCLRVHGLDCDLAHHEATSDLDKGTICLTPSVTQLMGDVLNVSVPSGSVVGRILTFDHVGNDMSDIDLNEFREKGESPTFFCCDRQKIENALLSLCNVGANSCNVLANPAMGKGALEVIPEGGVRVNFTSGVTQDYLGVICTARNRALIPELTSTLEELKQHQENEDSYKEQFVKSVRWLEVCVPPLPELGKFEKRFTPGSQEIVEILTPKDAKMTVRPTMMATKLFYNVTMTIPDDTPDPRSKSSSTKQFWDDVAMHWTGGVPGYVSHTMFKAMFNHVQENFNRNSALVYRTPVFIAPHWQQGGGRLIKIGHSSHGSCFDAVDVSDAQGFTDCFALAQALAASKTVDVDKIVSERRLQVMQELDNHTAILNYGLKERGQLAYMKSRFAMKFMGRYKGCWRNILKHYVTLIAK